MEPITLSILTFPQYIEAGRLHFNILIIPRNLNPLLPIKTNHPAFADAILDFKVMVIDNLDGLPVTTNVSSSPSIILENPVVTTRNVWEALKTQMEASDGMKIDDLETKKPGQKAQADVEKYKDRSIRKYLPESYRTSFNFVKAKTRYAVTGDEYSCAIKNKDQPTTDISTDRNTLSWGKVVAFCLRNPKLAEKAGLIYKASIAIDDPKIFQKGGWIYTELNAGSDFENLEKSKYAARIPALKGLTNRQIFAAVQFPVSDAPFNNLGYDEILRDAVVYDDGFAKIVHANQPVNQDLLQENDSSNPPLKDIGIRLGWDDEQIAIWYNRQMLQKEEQSGLTIDAPLGVFGYRLDARKAGTTDWLSQNSLKVEIPTVLTGGIPISDAGHFIEPGVEVHPAAHGDSKNDGFWLPMYFASWAGHPVTMANMDAEDINMLKSDKVIPSRPDVPTNTINSIPKKVNHPYRPDPKYILPLLYGENYEFRVRLMDISGGGAKLENNALNGGEKPTALLHFKRHVAAGALKIININEVYDTLNEGTAVVPLLDTSILENLITEDNPVLKIKRPLLGYPAVVYTGKYTNAVDRLKAILENFSGDRKGVDIGLSDPDVDVFRVRVEAKSLDMDNGRSLDGKDSHVVLYEKDFDFASDNNDFDQEFPLRIVYQDVPVIDVTQKFKNTGKKNELVLPTSRNLRITFIPIIKSADNDYGSLAIAEGKNRVLNSYKAATDESGLLSDIDGALKAVYLQPENLVDQHKVIANNKILQINLVTSSTPPEISRLADAFNLIAHNLTIEGEKGARVQFGCSKMMRHSLAPDSSSVSFSSLGELFNHWIIGVNFSLLRDWTWNGLLPESFLIERQCVQAGDIDLIKVGTINVSNTASINSLSAPDRLSSRIIFLDGFDPKSVFTNFPKEIHLLYRITAQFKSGEQLSFDKEIDLPITIAPRQTPKLISAGIALSPYISDPEKYASTEIRQRFLWLEMDAPPEDPNDTYFARVLSNAPDPLLCKISQQLVSFDPVDPPLNINAEKIREIIPNIPKDYAGMGAMQEMIKDDGNDLSNFYMLPLPPGLHADSDELFGFFSYEIRLGHKKEMWTTAQARYGRPLRANGVQHPAPALTCNVFRRKTPILSLSRTRIKDTVDGGVKLIPTKKLPVIADRRKNITFKNEIIITAPFASAVLNGQDISATPPQTTLWYMLYAQVKQADGKSYRNLLIHSGYMPYVAPKRKVTQKGQLLMKQEGIRNGIAILQVADIENRLVEMALPKNINLSVLCVEMFPMENKWQLEIERKRAEREGVSEMTEPLNPITTGLGNYRIYRTSPLVPVAEVCCDDC